MVHPVNMEGNVSSSTTAEATGATEVLEAPLTGNVSVLNPEASHIDDIVSDNDLLQKHNLPSNYIGSHVNMVDAVAAKSKKRAFYLISEACSILGSCGLEAVLLVVDPLTGETRKDNQFYTSAAMGNLLNRMIGNKGESPNEAMIEASQIARGKKALFCDHGISRQRIDCNSSNGDSKESFIKGLVRNLHMMYTTKSKKHNDVSISVEGGLKSLEEQLISFYKKGYYIEMSMIEYLCSSKSLRHDKTMPIFGCDVDINQRHLLPVHATREHWDIMSEWHRILLTGKARIKKNTDSEAQNRGANGCFAIVEQPSEASI